jgi:tRNA wybutosine-synthesizing protein 1
MALVDAEDALLGGSGGLDTLLVFIVSTGSGATLPEGARGWSEWLDFEAQSPRSGACLSRRRFAVFGLGDSAYGANFAVAARTLERQLLALGAKRAVRKGTGNTGAGEHKPLETLLGDWLALLLQAESARRAALSKRTAAEAREEARALMAESDSDDESGSEGAGSDVEMEDIGADAAPAEVDGLREMLTDRVKASLVKSGYKVIGSHSAVKLCRWTKAQLRGRGGCYKHTMYGITSYRCMEMTPSMACANKCTFCWRDYRNPVATEFNFVQDPPDWIVREAIARHTQMIRTLRGVPGVEPDRYQEALQPRHCALSLVGEPIIYPAIGKLLEELHSRHISSFLVSNAQFPDKMAALPPVTQLYLSIDAADRQSLKDIDRPLFPDFWERFLASVDALRDRRDRTVFRLTLVKGWNSSTVHGYASLVRRARPDFIEVKGVTFAGPGTGARQMTMANVPFHEEVVQFCEALATSIDSGAGRDLETELVDESLGAVPEYRISSEHEHSNCVLLARTDLFLRDGVWHTWIDYPEFFRLLESGDDFSASDYAAPTPAWAVYGAPERGFDPEETRVRKVRKHRDPEGNARPDAVLPRSKPQGTLDVATATDW